MPIIHTWRNAQIHSIMTQINKRRQQQAARKAPQSYLHFGIHINPDTFPNYETTRVYKAKATSAVKFLRGIEINDDTAF